MHTIEDVLDIAQHFVSREANHAITAALKMARPRGVVCLGLGMLIAIDLDHDLRSRAHEIGDERTQRNLPLDLESAEPAVARAAPEFSLGIAGTSPQPPRAFDWRGAPLAGE